MNKNHHFIKCWEHFQCNKKACPAYESNDLRCWLQGSTFCHEAIKGSWLNKLEACMKCEVLSRNFTENDWKVTFQEISQRFDNYRKQVEEKQLLLESSKRKLQEFKITSIYLLRELDKKSKEVQQERDTLEMRVKERTKELYQAQAKLIQSIKMAAIGRFSAGIAHEINNPLGAIINFTRTLLGNPQIQGQNRGYLEMILKGLFRIEHIVKQILGYARKPDITPEKTDINQIARESVAFVQHKIDKKNIEVSLKLSASLPTVLIDPTQIQQVFNNILNNALDALYENGKLILKTKLKEDQIIIEFIDNGIGIEKKNFENLYDPFYTTKEVGKGTGLGLFICYNILHLYDGSLDIKSKKGEGTHVVVRLPVSGEK